MQIFSCTDIQVNGYTVKQLYSCNNNNTATPTCGIVPPIPTETSERSCITFIKRSPKQRQRARGCRKYLNNI